MCNLPIGMDLLSLEEGVVKDEFSIICVRLDIECVEITTSGDGGAKSGKSFGKFSDRRKVELWEGNNGTVACRLHYIMYTVSY